MKKLFYLIFILFGLIFLVSPVGSALARQVATVTATFIPPSVTPTLSNFSCPVGTPAGWGTYTPSALWSLECGNCGVVTTPTVTGTAVPTLDGTLYPTQISATGTAQYLTGTPVYTPAFTSTPTVLDPPQMSCGVSSSGIICEQVDDFTLRFTGSVNGAEFITLDYAVSWAYPDTYMVIQSNNQGIEWLHYNYQGALPLQIWNGGANAQNTLLDVLPTWHEQGTSDGGYGFEHWTGTYTNHFFSGENTSVNFYSDQSYQNTANYFYYRNTVTTISVIPIYLEGTPSPTPTSVSVSPPVLDTGYCSSVSPVVDDFGFELFPPDGEPNCDMGWQEFGIGEYLVPSVQICFQPSKFGVIRLFGSDYEVGVFGLMAAAAFMWRYFRTV